jgi:tight adherence protein C
VNLEFVLAISFGFGVAGVISNFLMETKRSLVARVRLAPVAFDTEHKTNVRQTGTLLLNRVRSESSSRLEHALFELPELIDLLVVSLRAGNGIHRSFENTVPRSDGALAIEFARVLKAVEFGAAFGAEVKSVSKSLPHPQVSEFVNKVSLALERGTPLAQMLSEQAVSIRAEIKSKLLKQAGRNETRMLIPLVFLILPITVLFAIYPSLELLNFGFI